MEKTSSYTYFFIESRGEITREGFLANENAKFDPDEITKSLGIEPFKAWKADDVRPDGSVYLFSSWAAEKSFIGRVDVESQCLETIQTLKTKIPQLQRIREHYEVNVGIMIVSNIHQHELPQMRFNEEIIQFCYESGAAIEVDMYSGELEV